MSRGGKLPDAEARKRATTDFGSNLVVLAGAGTGKTSLLVERCLNAIGSGHVEVDRIAAITFTEKAAAEMRERMMEGLGALRAMAAGEAEPDRGAPAGRAYRYLVDEARAAPAAIAERALAALESLEAASIATIHAFCSELLHAHPVEAGVDPRFQVDTGEQAAALFETEWEAFLTRELGAEGRQPALWRRVLDHFALAELGPLARGLVEFSVPEELLREAEPQSAAAALLEAEARALDASIAELTERMPRLTPAHRDYFADLRDALAALREQGLAGFHALVASRPGLRKKIDDDFRPRPKDYAGALDAATTARLDAVGRECRLLCKWLAQAAVEPFAALVELLGPFAVAFRQKLLLRGWVGFDGLLALARDLLRDVPEVRARLKRRYRMVLVDELQDTDPTQYEIVLFLAEAEAEAAADPYTAQLEPGRLFVVGDPKQSIYRFRGADYAAFRRVVARIEATGGACLDLVGNFRSVAGIVDPVNALFAGDVSTWRASDYQPDYVRIHSARGGAGPAVEIWTLDLPDKTKVDPRRHEEGRLIAAAIDTLVASRAIDGYGRIEVLFRAFNSIPPYLRPLREHGIPFVVDGGKDFLKRPEVSQSLAALRTIAQPGDETALVAFLRSPAGGVSDPELADYAAAGGGWRWSERPDDRLHPRIAACFRTLRELSSQTRHLPADATVRRITERIDLFPLAAAAFEGAQRVANLQKLVAAASGLGRDGRLSLEQVLDQIQEGGIAALESDSPLADDLADAVGITSIHKMKGLESEWVFLPDLARGELTRGAAFDKHAVRVLRSAQGLPLLAIKAGEACNPAWVGYELEHARHEEAEEIRVLYVALTRARDRLVLVCAPTTSPGPWMRALAAWGYRSAEPPDDGAVLAGGRVLHLVKQPESRDKERPAPRPERLRSAVAAYEAVCHELRARSSPPFLSPSDSDTLRPPDPGGSEHDFVPRAVARARDLGKAAGIVAHRLLERWNGARPGVSAAELRRLCAESAPALGVAAAELYAEAAAIFAGFSGSELEQQLGAIEPLGRELPMLLEHSAGTSYRGTIDLLYRDRDGTIVVADYKTDREVDAAALGERYGAQLRIYAAAVQKAMNLLQPPRKELWLLRSGRRVELP